MQGDMAQRPGDSRATVRNTFAGMRCRWVCGGAAHRDAGWLFYRYFAVCPIEERFQMIIKQLAIAAAVMALAQPACAVVVAQWNFNSPTPDGNVSTGWPLPSVGAGGAGLFGFTSFFYATGTGSTDPAPADNAAWYTRPYPAQGTGDKAAGVMLTVSTLDLTNILVSWDQLHADNASKYVQVRYATSDSAPLQDVPGGLFSATLGGNTWYSRSLDLSNLPGVNNNASLRLAIVPTFAPGTTAYEASSSGFSYGPNGPLAYDMVTFSAAVPEPGSFALFVVGACAIGFLIRSRGTVRLDRAARR